MVLQNNGNKKRVWRDIQPVMVRPTPAPVAPQAPSKKKLNVVAAITHSSAYLFLKKQFIRIPFKFRLIGGACLILLIALGIYFLMTGHPSQVTSGDSPKTDAAGNSSNGPDYPTILPEGKTIRDLGGWIRASPLDKNPVFAYADKIDMSSIKVSEQPLPGSFKNDTSQKIEELLTGFKSHEKIIAGNTDVHLGTAENSSQSAIFYRDNLLVLITSTMQIQNNQWIDYITSLK